MWRGSSQKSPKLSCTKLSENFSVLFSLSVSLTVAVYDDNDHVWL